MWRHAPRAAARHLGAVAAAIPSQRRANNCVNRCPLPHSHFVTPCINQPRAPVRVARARQSGPPAEPGYLVGGPTSQQGCGVSRSWPCSRLRGASRGQSNIAHSGAPAGRREAPARALCSVLHRLAPAERHDGRAAVIERANGRATRFGHGDSDCTHSARRPWSKSVGLGR